MASIVPGGGLARFVRDFAPMDGPPRILVVDDNAALRENIAEALEDEGYAVELAEDGLEALALLERDPPPDVVLFDLVMPGIDGRELVRRIRAERRWDAVRLVMTSGHSGPAVPDDPPVDAFLPKPFGLDLLIRTLKTVRARSG